MILVGNQRGSAQELARHLMKDENEAVVVYEIRGFASEDLMSAFEESQAISRATRCRQHLYALSLNPPREATLDPKAFEDAIDRAEERLGLRGQPRAIVFHEKRGFDGEIRRHAHAVWCRIDTEAMRAIPLPHTRLKLQDLARELYVEHDWQMPRGFVRHEEADPRNYSLAEWQQAKRAKVDPQRLKVLFQECWAISDSRVGFAQALKQRGYILARGDRRGVVAVDHTGEVYAVARWVGIKTKQVRARIGDGAALPDVETATAQAAGRINDRLKELRREQAERALDEKMRLAEQRARLRGQQEAARRTLVDRQRTRQTEEAEEREARHRRGWRGLIDWVTGRRRRIEAENRALADEASIRDKIECRALQNQQAEARRDLRDRVHRAKAERKAMLRELDEDIRELEQRYEHARGSANSCDNIVCPEPPDLQRRRRRKRHGPSLH